MAETLHESFKPIQDLARDMEAGAYINTAEVELVFNTVRKDLSAKFSKDPERLAAINERLDSLQQLWEEKVQELVDANEIQKGNILVETKRGLEDMEFQAASEWARLMTDPDKAGAYIPDYEGTGSDNKTRWTLSGYLTAIKRQEFSEVRHGTNLEEVDFTKAKMQTVQAIYRHKTEFAGDHILTYDDLLNGADRNDRGLFLKDQHDDLLGQYKEGTFASESMGYLMGLISLAYRGDRFKYKTYLFRQLDILTGQNSDTSKMSGEDASKLGALNYEQKVQQGQAIAEMSREINEDQKDSLEYKAYEISKGEGSDDFKRGKYQLLVLKQLMLPSEWLEKGAA